MISLLAFMASVAEDFMKEGWVNIIGGCCGTTPLHIEELQKYQKNTSPG